MENKNISIKKNAIMGGINKLVSLIFPLISFTYVSRVLGVANYGKYNFSQSIYNYFLLIASLGISTYAIREGVKYRDEKEKMGSFVSQIFSINLIMTIISYIALGFLLIASPNLYNYRICICICSIAMIFTAVGVEWLFSIYEEYTYITIRNILFKVISLALMLIFVKKQEDYLIYAGICVFASSGSCILNFFKARTYCNIRFTLKTQLKNHFKPILIFAAINIAVYVYNSSDITMLGLLADDNAVGLYSAASKMYQIAKSTLLAILTVTIPRLSLYVNNKDKSQFINLLNKVINYMNLFMAPMIALMIIEGKDILLIIAGSEYVKAYPTHVILTIAILCSMYAWISSQCILVPNGRENDNLYGTILGAIINVLLNFIFIPKFYDVAAAATTVIAELFVAIYCTYKGKKYIKYKLFNKNTLSVVLAVVIMSLTGVILVNLFDNIYIRFLGVCIGSFLVYVLVLIFSKNIYLLEILKNLKERIGKKK